MTAGGTPNEMTLFEVLASIRRTIQEVNSTDSIHDTGHAVPQASTPVLAPVPDQEPFDLPAMFRNSPPTRVPSSDASVPSAHGMIASVEQHDTAPARFATEWSPLPGTSIKPPRLPDAISIVPRDIASCRDSVAQRMAGAARAPDLTRPLDALTKTTPDIPKGKLGNYNYLLGEQGGHETNDGDLDLAPPQTSILVPASPTPRDAQPPAFSRETAELLRPILRHWLQESMDRICRETLAHTLESPSDHAKD